MKRVPATLYRCINLTMLAALLLVSNEFLFAFTKMDSMGEINNTGWVTSPVILFAFLWLFFAGIGLILCLVIAVISLGIRRLFHTKEPALFLHAAPAFFVALTILIGCDYFTFSLLRFSSITHSEGEISPLWDGNGDAYLQHGLNLQDWIINAAYLIGFLVVWTNVSAALWRRRLLYPWLNTRIPARALAIVMSTLTIAAVIVSVRYAQQLPRVPPERLQAMPNIVVLTVESALADFSSAYADQPTDVTPFLEELSRESIRVEDYFSNAWNSREALNTILSGLHPLQHRGGSHLYIIPETVTEMNLPNVLRRHGYEYDMQEIAGSRYSEADKNFAFAPIPPSFRRFEEERYTVEATLRHMRQRYERILFNRQWPGPMPDIEALQRTMEEAARAGRPFFMHVHAMASHGPFDTCTKEMLEGEPDIVSWTKDPLLQCYLLKLREADSYARSISQLLKDMGQDENTIFIVLGDHEPQPWYVEQASAPFRNARRIPLLIRLPHKEHAGKVVRSNVQTIDLLPSIVDFLKLPAVPWSMGRSIFATDFDAREVARPILKVILGYKREIIVCNRIFRFERALPDTLPPVREWELHPDVSARCADKDLPSVESVLTDLRALQITPEPITLGYPEQ